MRRIRFFAFALVSFVAVSLGTLLAPGTFLNRAFSAALCTLFSFNLTVCTVDLGRSSQRVVAANPPAVVADISDYLQAQRDPSEFGDEQSAPSPQQSNPQAPPFPQDPGPNFPVRREFDEPGTNPANTSPRPGQTIASNSINFEAPLVRQLSSDTFEMDIVSKEGCNFTTLIRKKGEEIYQESIRFTPSSLEICGIKGFTANLEPNGSRIEVQINGSPNSLIAEIVNDNSVKFFLKSQDGETELGIVSNPNQQTKGLNTKQATTKICDFAKKTCAGIQLISGTLSIIETGLAATSPVTTALGTSKK